LRVSRSGTRVVVSEMSRGNDVANTWQGGGLVSAGLLALTLWLPAVASAEPAHFSSEYRVETPGYEINLEPQVTRLASGEFIVVRGSSPWFRNNIVARRLTTEGVPFGTEFVVNTYTGKDSAEAAVAPLADGGFVVVWTMPSIGSAPDGSGSAIGGQRFASDATAVGTEFIVNTYTSGMQHDAEVAALSDGGFVVVWRSGDGTYYAQVSTQDGDGEGAYGQRYDASALPNGTEFQVNAYTTGEQLVSAVVGHADGGFTVAFSGPTTGGDGGAFARRYDSSGAPAGTAYRLDDMPGSAGPALAVLGPARMVAAWAAPDVDGSKTAVVARLFSDDGTPEAPAFQVNTYTTNDQQNAALAPLADGGFLVAWASGQVAEDGNDGDWGGIAARRFDSTGVASDTEFRLDADWKYSEQLPSVAADPDGGFVAVWGRSGGGKLSAVRACVDTTGDGDGDGVGDSCDVCNNLDHQLVSIKPKLRFKFIANDDTVGNDTFKLRGEFQLPAGLTFADVDPTSVPIRIETRADTGHVPFEATLTTATFAGRGTAGWKLARSGAKWSFQDKTGSPASGIVAALIQDRSKKAPGRARILLKGKNATYVLHPGDVTVDAVIVLVDGSAGECVETAFVPEDCRFGGFATGFSCRQ
jgi:hypothetical protein